MNSKNIIYNEILNNKLFSEANKKIQNYRGRPISNSMGVCCTKCMMFVETKSEGYITYNKFCSLGGFKLKLFSTCDEFIEKNV